MTQLDPRLAVAVRALQTIKRDEGKVCDQYEICVHLACSSSYAAWAIADATLRHMGTVDCECGNPSSQHGCGADTFCCPGDHDRSSA